MNLEKLDRIQIRNEQELKTLLAWRDTNKDLVRDFHAVLKEGLILFEKYRLHFKFRENNDWVDYKVWLNDVYVMEMTSVKNHSDKDTNVIIWKQKFHHEILSQKDREELTQDTLTVLASIMAYMEHYTEHVQQRKELTNVKKKGKGSNPKKNRMIKMGRRVYDVKVPPEMAKKKTKRKKAEDPFPVRGHWRHFASGKATWISQYTKGDKDKERKPSTYKM